MALQPPFDGQDWEKEKLSDGAPCLLSRAPLPPVIGPMPPVMGSAAPPCAPVVVSPEDVHLLFLGKRVGDEGSGEVLMSPLLPGGLQIFLTEP